MLSCSIWFFAPSLRMDGGLESRWVGRVYGVDCAIRIIHTTYAAALKTTTHPQTRCRKPYAATQDLMLLRWAYTAETCRAKNTSIKLPRCTMLTFHIISWEEVWSNNPQVYKTLFTKWNHESREVIAKLYRPPCNWANNGTAIMWVISSLHSFIKRILWPHVLFSAD